MKPKIAPPSRPPQTEVLPFRPGQIIGQVPLAAVKGSDELTEAELALLQSGGYKDGDPVPDLANTTAGKRLRMQVEQVKRDAADIAGLTPIDPASPPLQLQPTRDISRMPPDEAAKAAQTFREMGEIRNSIAQARARAAEEAAYEEVPEHMSSIPGYLEAMATTNEPPSVEFVDDIGLSEGKPRLRLKKTEPAPSKVQVESKAGGSLEDFRVVCPRCSFDLNSELVTPTLDDKVNYIALVMGEQKRFRRQVSLFGGRIVVAFRSLTTAEENLAFTQVDNDAKDGKIANLVLYTAALEDYKMLMCVESVQRKGKAPVMVAPIDKYEYDEKNKTALPEFKEWLDAEVFLAASVRHAVEHAYVEFQQVLKYMEAKAPDSDFFFGIG